MAQQGREELFLRILIFFAVFTGIIGVINLAASGAVTSATLSNAISGGGINNAIQGQMYSVNPQAPFKEGANTATGIAITGIDFTTLPAIDINTTILSSGMWALVPGRGLVLEAAPFLGATETVHLRNVQSVGNVYTVNYLIDNSEAGGDWHIYPRSYFSSLTVYDLDVSFEQDGIHIKDLLNPINFIVPGGDIYFYPLPGARDTIAGGSTITTTLTEIPATQTVGMLQPNSQTSILSITKDGINLFTTKVASAEPGTISNDDIRHGGVGSNSGNFILKGIPSTNMLSTQDTVLSNTGGITPTDPLSAFGSFLSLVSAAMGIGGQGLIPIWLSAIILLPALAVLILIGIEILRGV